MLQWQILEMSCGKILQLLCSRNAWNAEKHMNTSKCSFQTGDVDFETVLDLNSFAPTEAPQQLSQSDIIRLKQQVMTYPDDFWNQCFQFHELTRHHSVGNT